MKAKSCILQEADAAAAIFLVNGKLLRETKAAIFSKMTFVY